MSTEISSKTSNNKDNHNVPIVENKKDHKDPVLTDTMSKLSWYILCLSGVLVYGTYTILAHMEERKGQLEFSSSSLILVCEMLKLLLSLGMLYQQLGRNVVWPGWRHSLPFAIPAVLYAFNNNISLLMQVEMDPATYQVLGNMKILSTAILYKAIIKKPITPIQWLALFMLLFAGCFNSYGGIQTAATKAASATYIHISTKGLIMMTAYCIISGLAGVYTELILKNRFEMSIHLQNSLLYVYGIIINAASFSVQVYVYDRPWNLFHGYTFITILIALNVSTCGLIMAAIMKHGNNITRMFIVSTAMVVTTALSVIIFNLSLNSYFSISFILVIGALYLYNKP